MQNFLERLDSLAGIETENVFARWLERAAFALMILMFASAPHSIAATQSAWLLGMLALFVRLFLKPRPRLVRTPLDFALWAFFGWSIVSCAFSYAPDISFNKLRATSALFLIFYSVVNAARTKRAVVFLAFTMIFSCLINVVWTPIQRLIGRGVEIHGVAPDSPLAKALFVEGDTLLEANGAKIKTPEDLINRIEASESTKIKFYRPDFEFALEVKRADLLAGETALQKLGIESWRRSHNWRSSGFYGHYTTYAEVLQLIASLVFGLFVASLGRKLSPQKTQENAKTLNQTEQQNFLSSFLRFSSSPFFLFCVVAAILLALLLTVTRASQLGFLVSAAAIVFVNGNRKLLLGLAVVMLPIVVGGLFFLQRSRGVEFFDAKDDSTIYRQTMYRDGVRLWTENARHLVFGVGMDSIRRFWREWNLYDGGKLPQGHFHSTPLQLLVEQGTPALLLWLWVLWRYARTLFLRVSGFDNENSKSRIQNPKSISWLEKGILLGGLGGLVGFFTGGLVHYNLGDAEVAMVFFMLMGLSVGIGMMNEE